MYLPRIIALPALMLALAGTAGAQDISRAQYHTPQGVLIVTTRQPAPRDHGAPPAFATLAAATGGFIDAHAAQAYPPLANDFIQADRNRDGRISRAEYERWLRQP